MRTWDGPSTKKARTSGKGAAGAPHTKREMKKARKRWREAVVKETRAFFADTFKRVGEDGCFEHSRDLWIEATRAWVKYLRPELHAQMQPGYGDLLCAAVLKKVEAAFNAEVMFKIKSRIKCSDAALQVIADQLCREFNTETRRWAKRPLGDIGLPLHKQHAMPQLAGRSAVRTMNKKLRAELGLQFTADGTLVTIDPTARLKTMVTKAYEAGQLEEGDTIKVHSHPARPPTSWKVPLIAHQNAPACIGAHARRRPPQLGEQKVRDRYATLNGSTTGHRSRGTHPTALAQLSLS